MARKSRMPDRPDPLPTCRECGKVDGDFKGWFGPQCQCGIETGHAAARAHSIPLNTRS